MPFKNKEEKRRYNREYMRKYNKRPEVKERHVLYERERRKREDVKQYNREYKKRPHVRVKQRKYAENWKKRNPDLVRERNLKYMSRHRYGSMWECHRIICEIEKFVRDSK